MEFLGTLQKVGLVVQGMVSGSRVPFEVFAFGSSFGFKYVFVS